MTVDVGQAKVLLIPRASVIDEGDKKFVFVAKSGNIFEEREVQTGSYDGNGIEVLKGIKLNELVVSEGGTALLGTAMKSAEGTD
jgi:multidrug efflux pump subunit AcrA (membrane-fusion protein)